MIPRGTSVMELRLEGGEREVVQDTVIYGNRKFTGDIGDEDDDTQPESNGQWKKYFLKDMDEAHQVVCMKKINGDAAHFSGRIRDGQFYLIVGTKNVHMIIREEKDIDKYTGDRYTFAKVVPGVYGTLFLL
ncbi:hypothetical protein GWK47_038284 [Chionoecetes opilio]|uniref:Uncharacterized protein n=1 Tax=Chionoecetes opilio TaxID=41210 RepID=A0A8J5D1X5_CHIOP|nr:hypothetical protein GWK47_038284 [Chionoecetes opilio]